ncbi:hypothetical protein BH20CHL6_BH20CHL6_19080 [soil metagenome]
MTRTETAEPQGRDAHQGIRPMRAEDIEECLGVFYAAQDELHTRNGQQPQPRNPEAIRRLLNHLLAADPPLVRVASAEGSEVATGVSAFIAALSRQQFWFLSFLFVHPEQQGRGLGRRLLESVLPGTADDEAGAEAHEDQVGGEAEEDQVDGELGVRGVRATCVDALQPVSTGLYARYGLVPRVPLYALPGDLRRDALRQLPVEVDAEPFEATIERAGHAALTAAVTDIDRQLLGYERGIDHQLWRAEKRQGVLYRARGSGPSLGYGYAQASGRVGPIAALDGSLTVGILADLVRRVTPVGGWQIIVPGVCAGAMVALLRAGLRVDGSPGLFCSTGPSIDFERYLPAGFAVL